MLKKDNFVKLWTAHTEYCTSVFTEDDFQGDTCFSEYRSHSWRMQGRCSLRLRRRRPKTSVFFHSWTDSHILLGCDWKRHQAVTEKESSVWKSPGRIYVSVLVILSETFKWGISKTLQFILPYFQPVNCELIKSTPFWWELIVSNWNFFIDTVCTRRASLQSSVFDELTANMLALVCHNSWFTFHFLILKES